METGSIVQVCWVVRDIAAAEESFTQTFGVAKWLRIPDVHFAPDTCRFRGEPADYTIHVSLADSAGLQLELIQPVAGENLYTEHLDQHGPGLHHVGYLPPDFDAAVAAAAAQGMAVTQEGTMPGMRFAYLDGSAGGAPHIELVDLSDDMRKFFESLSTPA